MSFCAVSSPSLVVAVDSLSFSGDFRFLLFFFLFLGSRVDMAFRTLMATARSRLVMPNSANWGTGADGSGFVAVKDESFVFEAGVTGDAVGLLLFGSLSDGDTIVASGPRARSVVGARRSLMNLRVVSCNIVDHRVWYLTKKKYWTDGQNVSVCPPHSIS